MVTAHYEKGRLLEDAYNEKPDYYLLCTDDTDVSQGYRNYKKYPNIKTEKLPDELAQFFGPQNVNGYNVYVTRMSFRTSDSGNGSFIDQFCSFEGGCGAQHKSITYYRTKRWPDTKPGNGAIFEGEDYAKRIDTILNKTFTVEETPEWYDVEYQCSYIRKLGGLNYPDVKCSGWRWSHGAPYVSNKYDDRGTPDFKHLRVYVENLKAHFYLEAAETLEVGDSNLVEITFSRHHDKNPNQFCNIGQWNDSKKEDPGGVIRWQVQHISDKKDGWPYKMAAVIGDKVQFTRHTWGSGYYRIQRISYHD
jgi:hypothetical protein